MSYFRRLFGLPDKVCETCEVLKMQLAYTQRREQYLLDKLLEPKLEFDTPPVNNEPEPLIPKHVPWPVKREMLEQEDRARARVIREQAEKVKKDIEHLEKELGVKDAGQVSETV